MSVEENKAIARRFWDLYNEGKIEEILPLFAPDAVIHFPGAPGPLNTDAFKQVGEMFRAGFPDLYVTVEDSIAEGDRVVERTTATGTHTGVFQGIPPTGKKVQVTGITINRIVDGKIVERWNEFDALGMMQQLGVIPTPG